MGLAFDENEDLYIAGDTDSGGFPMTPNAYQPERAWAFDFFISKMDNDLTTLYASTFLGGCGGSEERAKIFVNILQRSSGIDLDDLAQLLEMNKMELYRWLVTLPEKYGFIIVENRIEFVKESLEKVIDDLIADFIKMEEKQHGKN